MNRTVHFLAAGALVLAAACSSPSSTSPTALTGATAANDAKPGGNGGSVPHTLGFSGHLSGSGTVSGSISGSYASGNLSSSASGNYVLTVSTVDPGDPQFCTAADLDVVRAALGSGANLVDGRSGTISIQTNQSAADGRTGFAWNLGGIAGADGRTWTVAGNSTNNFPAYLSSSSDTTALTLTMNNGVIGFNRLAANGRKKDFTVGCRATFTLTLTRQ